MKISLRPIQAITAMILILSSAGCARSDKSDPNTIVVWHWMSDREETFSKLADKFKSETGIQVKFELYAPSEVYSQRVKASAQTNTLPDIYGVLGEKRDFASFINSGYVVNLTEPLERKDPDSSSWKETLFEKAVAVNAFVAGNEFGVTPGVYGVPIDVTTIQMLYNKKLYRQAGLNPERPPQTWNEFISHARALKDKDIPRLVSGFGEIWMIDALASNFAMNLMGQDKVFQTYAGKVPYTDPDWIQVLSLFKQMADEKILVEGAVTMVNKTAEQTFANERAAWSFNGSWCVNVYKGMNPNLEYGVFLPPSPSSRNRMKIWGGAGGSFVVNERSPRKDSAIRFLRWLTDEPQQTYLAAETLNLPSNKRSLSQIPPILAEFADDMEEATHPNVYPNHESPVVSEAFNKGIQSILIGERSPEEIAAEVQKVKEKEQAKKK